METPNEYLKRISPNEKYGIREHLQKERLRGVVENIMQRYAEYYHQQQLLIHSVVVNEANWCNDCQKPIRMINNTLQLLCECEVSEVAFNCFGGNHAKGIKSCVEHCGEDMCLKPNN